MRAVRRTPDGSGRARLPQIRPLLAVRGPVDVHPYIYVIHEFGLTTALRRTAQTRYPDGVESVGTQVGSSRGSAGEFLRLLSRCRNGTWTELGGTSVGRGEGGA
jgi:hypothetical protein